MPRSKKYLIFGSFLLILINCSPTSQNGDEDWEILFDGSDLAQWDTYLGPEFDENLSQAESQKKPPVGLNKDPKNIFQIVTEEGQKALKISGETWGGISTKKEFRNFQHWDI